MNIILLPNIVVHRSSKSGFRKKKKCTDIPLYTFYNGMIYDEKLSKGREGIFFQLFVMLDFLRFATLGAECS